MRRLFLLIARVCIGAVFLVQGVGYFIDKEGSEQMFISTLTKVSEHKTGQEFLPGIAEQMLPIVHTLTLVSIAFLIVGSLLVILGFKARFGALLLIIFLIPATIMLFPFWIVPQEEQAVVFAEFLKNTALIGGLLLLMLQHKKSIAASGKDD